MEDVDPNRAASGRRLTFYIENLNDYLIMLLIDLCHDPVCDRVLSGELLHPLIEFHYRNTVVIRQFNVPWIIPAALLADPVGPCVQ